ncbi:MAG: thiolase family protein [Candidatus Alcyoniella australis]|nr:thiolase family protein [Candidatus Alcyoniella australis]
MARRAAIVAVAQTSFERDKWYQRMQGMAWEVVKPMIDSTGLDFSEERGIGQVVTTSDDIFDARTISDNAMTDVIGAHYRCEEKVSQDGAQAVYYALASVLSGHQDLVMVVGHCKESQAKSRNMVTHLVFDPFFTRPVGLDHLAAEGIQARAYMDASGVSAEQLAQLVVRSRKNAQLNPSIKDLPEVNVEQVLQSPMLADPIRELMTYPVSDGAIGLIIAAEERVPEITDKPVWISGVGNCMDSFFLGERDLVGCFQLGKAAQKAYSMAGVSDPLSQVDLFEISDRHAYMLPQWAEGLGLCPQGAAAWLAAGGPDALNVNLSGGLLAGQPMILGGLARVAECTLQLRGEAGQRQVADAKRAVAHGITGPAGQMQTVVVLEG